MVDREKKMLDKGIFGVLPPISRYPAKKKTEQK